MTDSLPTRRSHPVFWVLWTFDAFTAAVVVFFFLWGVADGSVSSFNIMLWLGMLSVLAAVVGGGFLLLRARQPMLATALLLVVAFPGVMFTLFMLAVVVLRPRWN